MSQHAAQEQSTRQREIGQASWLVPRRVDREELLDAGEGTPSDVAASLADLWRINRFSGGNRAVTQHLYPRLRAHAGPATVLDIGAGSAQLAVLIDRWARRNRLPVRVIAADLSARHLDIARSFTAGTAVQLLQADVTHLPLPVNSADYLISSLFLHHFPPDQVVCLLREAFARARRGLIFSDVTRGWLPMIGFRLGQPIFARSYLTRYDGPASVRRAYTPSELRQMAEQADLTRIRLSLHPLWRMTLTADKS